MARDFNSNLIKTPRKIARSTILDSAGNALVASLQGSKLTKKWRDFNLRGDEVISEAVSHYIRDDCILEVLVAKNPKRQASKLAFSLYKSGETVLEFCQQYARAEYGNEFQAKEHIAWDFNNHFIDVFVPTLSRSATASISDTSGLHEIETEHPQNSSYDESDIGEDIELILDQNLSATECQQLIAARLGQGKFRTNVIEAWGLGETCALTGCNIGPLLIASHVKPWRDCATSGERLDGANGILLCAHVDRMFDKHLISFDDLGAIIFASTLDCDQGLMDKLAQFGMRRGISLDLKFLSNSNRTKFTNYLRLHRSEFQTRADGRSRAGAEAAE